MYTATKGTNYHNVVHKHSKFQPNEGMCGVGVGGVGINKKGDASALSPRETYRPSTHLPTAS